MPTWITKWGAIIVLVLVVGVLLLSVGRQAQGFSTWFSDSYIPKKIFIVEKFPARIIIVGEYADNIIKENNITTVSSINDTNMLKVINAVFGVPHQEGKFDWDLRFNFNHDFNTKEVRSTDRSSPIKKD